MTQLIQALSNLILTLAADILARLGIIQVQSVGTAKEHYPYEIAQLTSEQTQYERAALTGFPAILAAIADLKAFVTTQDSGLLAAIAALPAGSDIVIPSPSDNAAGVWAAIIEAGPPNATAGELLDQAGTWAEVISQYSRFPIQEDPHFSAGNLNTQAHEAFNFGAYFEGADWTTLPTYSTLLDFLEDQLGYQGDWQDNGAGEYYLDGQQYAGRSGPRVWCTFTVSDFAKLKARAGAPVWPGLANVTLGTPVAIDRGVTITEPMDGVLIAITSVDPKQMFYTYDDVKAYRHTGALAFFSDNGDLEPWQQLGFTSAVYCPRQLSRAAGVKLMSPALTVGTITPWVVT
jgi:hypothetical protein